MARSGLGNELNLVPVDRHTLLSKVYNNKDLFVLFPKKPAKKMAYIAGLPKLWACRGAQLLFI